MTKKVGKDVVDREFVCCIFYSYICYIAYGGSFMVRTAVTRVCSGNYRAAPYLNYFCIVPVSLAGVVPIWFAQLVSLLIVAIHAGNAFILCLSAVLVFCCCRLLECAVIV